MTEIQNILRLEVITVPQGIDQDPAKIRHQAFHPEMSAILEMFRDRPDTQ